MTKPYLDRREAADYLTQKGLKTSPIRCRNRRASVVDRRTSTTATRPSTHRPTSMRTRSGSSHSRAVLRVKRRHREPCLSESETPRRLTGALGKLISWLARSLPKVNSATLEPQAVAVCDGRRPPG